MRVSAPPRPLDPPRPPRGMDPSASGSSPPRRRLRPAPSRR